jgi:ribosomal protein S18 acetylase RimI-like enzyme
LPASLSIRFRSANDDSAFVEPYLGQLLRPAIADPIDSQGLFNADANFLRATCAIIGLGVVEQMLAVGLYITKNDDARIAYLNGVVVKRQFRGCGYGATAISEASTLLRKTQSHIRRIALTVRCDDAGAPRAAAFNTYIRNGFVPVRTFEVRISGLPVDRHFGPPGSKVKSMLMEKML